MQYKLKKSLGQHFLRDDSVSERIAQRLGEESFSCLLEVGPGGGALTRFLLKFKNVDFKAVEVDEEKVELLSKLFPTYQSKILLADILKMECPFEHDFAIAGNFPYNISSQILFRVLEWKDQVPFMIGMFQKEVAQRVAASPGSKIYGILSALLQCFYEIDYLFDVPPESFRPPPKVMSGVIAMKRKAEPFTFRDEKSLRLLVKTAFGQRRKTLRNAVRSLFDQKILEDPVFDKRAEALSPKDFADLTYKMK